MNPAKTNQNFEKSNVLIDLQQFAVDKVTLLCFITKPDT